MVGKPVEGKARDAHLLVRVLPEELAAWKSAAKRAGLTLSAWIRKLANDAAGRR